MSGPGSLEDNSEVLAAVALQHVWQLLAAAEEAVQHGTGALGELLGIGVTGPTEGPRSPVRAVVADRAVRGGPRARAGSLERKCTHAAVRPLTHAVLTTGGSLWADLVWQ